MSRINIQGAVLRFLLCFLCVVLAGFFVFGARVFNTNLPQFQFVGFGLILALFAAAIPAVRARWLILLVFVSYLGVVATAGSETSVRLIRDALGVVSIFSATGFGIFVMGRIPVFPVGKFVFWAAIFSLTQILAVSLLAEIQSVEISRELLFSVAKSGALIGAGGGLGFELAALVEGKLFSLGEGQD